MTRAEELRGGEAGALADVVVYAAPLPPRSPEPPGGLAGEDEDYEEEWTDDDDEGIEGWLDVREGAALAFALLGCACARLRC